MKLRIALIAVLFLSQLNEFRLAAQESIIQSNELLKMSLDELLNLKISTAGKKEQKISDVPASVFIISRDDIAKYGYRSVEEIIENVPGFYLIDDYCWLGQKNYGVRGFFSTGQFDHVCVLINGINQKSGLLDSYPTERIAVPVEAIDRIEVVRGPMSVMYGSGAFFGAINIITNNLDETNQNIYSAAIGTQNMYSLFAGLRDQSEKFRYSFYGSLYNDDGINEPFGNMLSDASIVTKPASQGGWNLDSDNTKDKLKTNRRYFSLNGSYKDISFDVSLIHSRKNIFETIAGYGDGSWVNYNSARATVIYNKKITHFFSVESKFSFTNEYHWVDNEFYFKSSYTNNLLRANYYDLEVIGRLNPTEKIALVTGLQRTSFFDYIILADYVGFGYLPDFEETYYNSIATNAFYTQLDYTISEKLKVVAGFRLERLNPYSFDLNLNFPDAATLGTNQPPTVIPGEFKPRNFVEFIPRLALLYAPGEKHVLKFLYGKAIKQPNPTANLDVALNRSPQLAPANIQTVEVNYIASFSPAITTNVSVFRNQLNNLISRLNLLTDEGSSIVSSNAGEMSTFGIEANLQLKPCKKCNMDLSVTWQDSKNEREGFEDIELEYAPKILAYARTVCNISANTSISVIGRYVDQMYAGWNMQNLDQDNHPVITAGDPYGGRLGYKTKARHIFDLNLRFNKLFGSSFYIDSRISNLFDQDVYYPTTTSNPLFDKGTMGSGRTFMITLGWAK